MPPVAFSPSSLNPQKTVQTTFLIHWRFLTWFPFSCKHAPIFRPLHQARYEPRSISTTPSPPAIRLVLASPSHWEGTRGQLSEGSNSLGLQVPGIIMGTDITGRWILLPDGHLYGKGLPGYKLVLLMTKVTYAKLKWISGCMHQNWFCPPQGHYNVHTEINPRWFFRYGGLEYHLLVHSVQHEASVHEQEQLDIHMTLI